MGYKGKKATEAEVAERVIVVYELLLREVSRQEIVRYASNTWDVCARQADTYIQRATKMIYEKLEVTSDKVFNKTIRQLENLYSEAYRNKQYKICHDIKKTTLEMYNLLKQGMTVNTGEVHYEVRLVKDE